MNVLQTHSVFLPFNSTTGSFSSQVNVYFPVDEVIVHSFCAVVENDPDAGFASAIAYLQCGEINPYGNQAVATCTFDEVAFEDGANAVISTNAYGNKCRPFRSVYANPADYANKALNFRVTHLSGGLLEPLTYLSGGAAGNVYGWVQLEFIQYQPSPFFQKDEKTKRQRQEK